MDNAERERIETEIRDEARRVALALADFPEFAIDIRDIIGETAGELAGPLDLDELHGIGSADDVQSDPDAPDFRRWRRLGELKLALDSVRGSRW